MPYANVPKKLWPKMERCVKRVMEDGKTKEQAIAICYKSIMGKGEGMEKAKWSTAYINDLPDSSFAYIESGGKKDKDGKTTPRSKRHLPYKDKSGKVDPAHVRNALARLNQTHIPASAKASAKKKLIAAARSVGIEVSTKVDSSEVIKKQTGKEVKETVAKDEKTKKVADEEVIEKAEEEAPKKEAKTEEPEKVEKVEDEKEATEKPEPVEKAEEPEEEVEKADEPEEEVEAEEPEEEVEKAEEEVEKAEEVEKTEEKAEAKEEPKAYEALLDAISKLNEKIDGLSELVKQSPDEGVAATEETPKEGAKSEAPEEEVTKVDEPEPEPEEEKAEAKTEKVDKADTSSDGDSEVLKALEEMQARIKKLEEAPAPSKVVVSKGFVGSLKEDTNRLDEISKRLKEIEKIRDDEPNRYTESLMDEALTLVDERKMLEGRQ